MHWGFFFLCNQIFFHKTFSNNRSKQNSSIPLKVVGDAGEKHVYEYEYNKLKKLGNIHLAEKIVKQYEDKTNFPGYDIKSFDEFGEEIYIEIIFLEIT